MLFKYFSNILFCSPALSPGVALLLQDSDPHLFSTPDKEALAGVVAFKDR